jgi:hypothetical protein
MGAAGWSSNAWDSFMSGSSRPFTLTDLKNDIEINPTLAAAWKEFAILQRTSPESH